MKRQKKQYRPIAGQKCYEKLLDWVTHEENCRWSAIGIWAYAALMVISIYISANIMNRTDLANIFMKLWFLFFPVAVILAMINPLSGGWELRAEKRLRRLVKECVERYGFCTYDELVARCMPVKIHLGIDLAIEKMLQYRELVQEGNGRFRLPDDNDRKKWRQEDLEKFGAKISFEDLKKIFALNLQELGESIYIEFSLGEHDGYCIGKTVADDCLTEVFWCSVDEKPRREFETFRELVAAELFDAQSLETVWDNAILTSINDQQAIYWLNENLL